MDHKAINITLIAFPITARGSGTSASCTEDECVTIVPPGFTLKAKERAVRFDDKIIPLIFTKWRQDVESSGDQFR